MEYREEKTSSFNWILVGVIILSFALGSIQNKTILSIVILLNIVGGLGIILLSRSGPKNQMTISLIFAVTWFYAAYTAYNNLRVLP